MKTEKEKMLFTYPVAGASDSVIALLLSSRRRV